MNKYMLDWKEFCGRSPVDEKETIMEANMFSSILIGGLFLFGLWVFDAFIRKPRKLRSRLEKQGIRGPVPSILYGNIPEIKRIAQLQKAVAKKSVNPEVVHSWIPNVFPHLEQWRKEYGPNFLYSTGNIQILYLADPEMVKVMSLYTSTNLGKPSYLSTEYGPLLGRGILASNGTYWAHQRKIIAPEFYLDKVKLGMVNMMGESTVTMLKTWENKTESCHGKLEIRVDEDLRSLSADIISRACFGRNYAQGEQIFNKLQSLQRLMSRRNIGVPGLRYIPNSINRAIRKLGNEIDKMILEVVKSRSDDDNKKDLLRMILSAAESYCDESNMPTNISRNQFIVDNCKNIYFAGHETAAISASWCLMTLAAYPEWQARAREEVFEICGTDIPTPDMLRKMKVLTMVIQETQRLYPPVAYVVREALQDVNFKEITIPKGINIQLPIPMIHQDQDLWGCDAHCFKPDRFAKGISGACKFPYAFMPFGLGVRTCLGQNFAMAELKVILSLALSKFKLSLAPTYEHSPEFRLVILPQYGVKIVLENL